MNFYKFDFQKQPGRERTRFYSPDPKDALVSVITPYYNAGKYFTQTFNSVMNQTFPWFEWIIVNDGSTNQADVDLLHRLSATDCRVTVITQENGGLSCARNTGIQNTHTDLVVPLDADDVLAPGYLECLFWGMYYNPDAAWCYTSSYGFHNLEYIWKYPFNAEKLKTYNFLNYTAMIRKKDIMDVGGYKIEKWSYYEDWRFWLEMLSLSKKPVHINSCLFWYRRLDSGMLSSINKDPKRVQFCNEIIEKAGAHADTNIQALEYPVRKTKYPFYTAKKIPWDRNNSVSHSRHRVMWIVPWLNMGGADKFNMDAIAGLKANGFDNFILTTQVSENEWQQKFEEYTDEIFCLADFLDPAHYLEFISYYIQSREIDTIMLTNSYDGYYMMPWIRQHFPDVVIVDYVHMEEWYWLSGGYARVSGALSGIVEKTYVCNSRTKQVICENFGRKEESVDCLYIGVDHNYYSAEKESPGFLHDMLQLSPDRPIILFPCRIHPQKRPFLMLQIAEKTRQHIPDIAFVVVGEGPQLDELKNAIHDLRLENTVFCIGATDQMRACYRDSALTLICSLKEGLALTAYESLAMGVPVISSNVGGQQDLIGTDVGALIPMMQKEEDIDNRNFSIDEITLYVEQICRIWGDKELYARLSLNSRKKIEEQFSILKMVQILCHEIELLHHNPEKRAQRVAISHMLNSMDNLASDYYVMYLQWCSRQAECEDVWNERCWFEKQWHSRQAECEKVWNERCWFEKQLKDTKWNLQNEKNQSFKTLVRKLLVRVKNRFYQLFCKFRGGNT